jgi:hypothetical protein
MKKVMPPKGMLLLVLLISALLVGCSRAVEATPQATQTPAPPPVEVTFCDINAADLCLEGFGQDVDERLLILFRTDDPLYTDIYIRAAGPEGDILFECQPSENSPENVYCLGEPFQEGESIKLNIYSKGSNNLIALGVFTVEYSSIPEPDVVFGVDATATPFPVPATPAPSEPAPSYPNPSYPNPTSVP